MKVEARRPRSPTQEIDEWIERLRERFAELEPASGPPSQGDFVTTTSKAVPTARRSRRLTRTDYLYFVGSGEFGPTLDTELLGKRRPARS